MLKVWCAHTNGSCGYLTTFHLLASSPSQRWTDLFGKSFLQLMLHPSMSAQHRVFEVRHITRHKISFEVSGYSPNTHTILLKDIKFDAFLEFYMRFHHLVSTSGECIGKGKKCHVGLVEIIGELDHSPDGRGLLSAR